MKKWVVLITAFSLFFSIHHVFREDFPTAQTFDAHQNVDSQVAPYLSHEERNQVSLILAHLFWNQLSQYSPFYDFDEVMKNLHDLEKEKIKPLDKSENQQQLLSFLHKIADYHDRCSLKAVDAYLLEIVAREDVVEVVPQKVYYEVIQTGNGVIPSLDSDFKMHLIESRLCEGEEILMLDTRSSNKPITLRLSDTIPGFAKGASTISYGERRKIYIHPDLAYGKYGHRGFQQLVICDIERLQ